MLLHTRTRSVLLCLHWHACPGLLLLLELRLHAWCLLLLLGAGSPGVALVCVAQG
jgi:hypothetical protein